MNILLLCRSLSVGGAERQITVLAKNLKQAGHNVSVAVFYKGNSLEQELIQRDVTIIDLKKKGRWDNVSFFIRLVYSVRSFDPAIIYSFLDLPNIINALLKGFIPGAKIIWGVRSSKINYNLYSYTRWIASRVEAFLSKRADLIICNSFSGMTESASKGFPIARLRVVNNGIDVDYFKFNRDGREALRQEWGINKGCVLIGLVARLDPIKDHLTFLRAAASLIREEESFRFVCVGDGPGKYRDELLKFAEQLNIEKHVVWAGVHVNMPRVYSSLDIAVSCSLGEGFSNTVLEAMACGVPCVVTDVGDSARIVGSTGTIVSPGSPKHLSAAIRELANRLSPQTAAAARAAIVDRYSERLLAIRTLADICTL
jgi:glycosyltransferase involved in cell wall biosynthesis